MANQPGIFLVVRDPQRINEARAGRSYKQIADVAECAPATVCLLATGNRHRVTAKLAARLEDALGVPRGDLFGLAPEDAELLAHYSATLNPTITEIAS
jgi:transcriptional regulator with XRE-family HTH domain